MPFGCALPRNSDANVARNSAGVKVRRSGAPATIIQRFVIHGERVERFVRRRGYFGACATWCCHGNAAREIHGDHALVGGIVGGGNEEH